MLSTSAVGELLWTKFCVNAGFICNQEPKTLCRICGVEKSRRGVHIKNLSALFHDEVHPSPYPEPRLAS